MVVTLPINGQGGTSGPSRQAPPTTLSLVPTPLSPLAVTITRGNFFFFFFFRITKLLRVSSENICQSLTESQNKELIESDRKFTYHPKYDEFGKKKKGKKNELASSLIGNANKSESNIIMLKKHNHIHIIIIMTISRKRKENELPAASLTGKTN